MNDDETALTAGGRDDLAGKGAKDDEVIERYDAFDVDDKVYQVTVPKISRPPRNGAWDAYMAAIREIDAERRALALSWKEYRAQRRTGVAEAAAENAEEDKRRRRRTSKMAHYVKIRATPEYRARRAAYMRAYRARP